VNQTSFRVLLILALAASALQASADVVTDWNSLLLDAIRNESTSPPLAARNLAILHTAIYDAVNAIDRTHETYFISLGAPAGASKEAAAVGAAYECLAELYPSQIAAFDAALDRFLRSTPASQSRDDGLMLGEETAFDILTWRSADGSSTSVTYIPGDAPGDWRRTPPFFRPPELPQWPYVVPFAMTNGAQFRPSGPPSLSSTRYAADFNMVKQLGASTSTNRTAEQTLIARFWSDFSYTVTPPGHWNQIAQNIATNLGLSLVEDARLFALLNVAMADGGIASWDAKYEYNSWRPITAIQEADLDGNPDTVADPNWLPLLSTPSFPEYMSGHSTFSGAASTILALFLGSNNVPFAVGSDALPNLTRSYTSLSGAAEEIGLSRIYGGIHFLSADLDGLATGRAIGNYVSTNFLLALPPARFLSIACFPDGRVQCEIAADPDHTYLIQSSIDLLQWENLSTNVPTSGTISFTSTAATNSPARFYRTQTLP